MKLNHYELDKMAKKSFETNTPMIDTIFPIGDTIRKCIKEMNLLLYETLPDYKNYTSVDGDSIIMKTENDFILTKVTDRTMYIHSRYLIGRALKAMEKEVDSFLREQERISICKGI